MCQAGNCADCQNQTGCSWYSNVVPGVPGKCDVANGTFTAYNLVTTCPTCQTHTSCTECGNYENSTGCDWYVLPGNIGGKCREASPAFAYTKVPPASCGTGNPCAGVATCQLCQAVTNATNASLCGWYTSKSPSFYNSKCDDIKPGVVDGSLYVPVVDACPVCAGTSCLTCKAESGCKWVAVSLGLAQVFGQCLPTATPTPSTKSLVVTCPITCKLHSCNQCTSNSACAWFTGGPSLVDDVCDVATAGNSHPVQKPAATPCAACLANECYECNGLPGCGWYAVEHFGIIGLQGCYSTGSAPSDRTLIANSNSKCKGVPSGSSQVTISIGVLLVLAFLA